MVNVHRDAAGQFSITLAPAEAQGDWLPSGTKGNVSLALRLYNPAPALLSKPEAAALPTVEPIGACP